MSTPKGFTRIVSIPDLGGYVIQNPLSPILQTSTALGAVGELSLYSVLPATFTLPLATNPGQLCGIKLIDTSVGGNVDILTSADPNTGDTQTLFAGIGAQSLFVMTLAGNVGECAIFTAGINTIFPDTMAWFLTSYSIGSTFAP